MGLRKLTAGELLILFVKNEKKQKELFKLLEEERKSNND